MIFIGVDAAWGGQRDRPCRSRPVGQICDAAWAIGVSDVAAWICEHADQQTLVFIDAPLVVRNLTGQRLCEKPSVRATGVGISQRTQPTKGADASPVLHCWRSSKRTAFTMTT